MNANTSGPSMAHRYLKPIIKFRKSRLCVENVQAKQSGASVCVCVSYFTLYVFIVCVWLSAFEITISRVRSADLHRQVRRKQPQYNEHVLYCCVVWSAEGGEGGVFSAIKSIPYQAISFWIMPYSLQVCAFRLQRTEHQNTKTKTRIPKSVIGRTFMFRRTVYIIIITHTQAGRVICIRRIYTFR